MSVRQQGFFAKRRRTYRMDVREPLAIAILCEAAACARQLGHDVHAVLVRACGR
jgi:hypothetical protein